MTRVLYHLTIARPKMPECEAVWQEVDLLRRRVGGGDVVYLNPSRHPLLRVPRLLYGFHRLRELRQREAGLDFHHIFNPDPYAFPILKRLRCPVLYSLTAGLRGSHGAPASFFAENVHTVVVADETDQQILACWGVTNTRVIRPGIDVTRFVPSPLPLNSEIRILVGSAPWVKGQFRSKGIDTLLDVAVAVPRLRLIFLWRGELFDEMLRRVRQRRLEERVRVLNRRVDVNAVLAGVHASVVLAESPSIIKAFPRSLLESLAAGKPVLVSQDIPLADIVTQTGCGRVVTGVTRGAVLRALDELLQDYEAACRSALQIGREAFSQEHMVSAYRELYHSICS